MKPKPPPPIIRDLIAADTCVAFSVENAEAYAEKLKEKLGSNPNPGREEIAQRLYAYAHYAVTYFDELPGLSGAERRALVLWGSRALVEACYLQLPRGPVLFTLEAYLGGTIRRAIAAFIGEPVSVWLEGFIELCVARLRIAKNAK
jgi:hypothetical protein